MSREHFFPPYSNMTRYIQHNGECKTRCPRGLDILKLDESNTNFTCVDLRRFSVCVDIVITDDSIRSLKNLKGCQIVRGFVDIKLTIDACDDENLLATLSETLLSIVEIHKYLKILGTAITDLGFLANLQRIRGIELESGRFSLILTNNKNLKRVWLSSQNVSVDRGERKLEANHNFCNDEKCEEESIEVEIQPNTYAAKIKWNATDDLSNLKFNLWRENEYLEESFCKYENAEYD